MLVVRFKDSSNVYVLDDFKQEGHVITLNGAEIPTDETSGFYISRNGHNDNWDYTGFTTLYRVVDEDTVQYSDDGSTYIPPTMNVTIEVNWDDGNNAYGVRPDVVIVPITINGVTTKYNVRSKQNWKLDVGKYPVDSKISIKPRAQAHYNAESAGSKISYTFDGVVPTPRTLSVTMLADALYDGNLVPLYVADCENNRVNFNNVEGGLKELVKAEIENDGFIVNDDGTVSIAPLK